MHSDEIISRLEEYKRILEKAVEDPKKRQELADSESVKKLLGIHENDLDDLWRDAQYYSNQGDVDKAIEALTCLILFEPFQVDYYTYAGTILFTKKQYKEAVNFFKSAALIEPEVPNLQLYIGRCLIELNEKDEAIEAFKYCAELAEGSFDRDVQEIKRLAEAAARELQGQRRSLLA